MLPEHRKIQNWSQKTQSLQDKQTQRKDNVDNLAKKVGEFNVEMATCTSPIEARQNEIDDTLVKSPGDNF